MKRFLVTTAIPETWVKDQPLLLLGDWCLTYGKNNVYKEYDYKIARYPWDDRKKLKYEVRQVSILYESILIDLSSKLNSIHGTTHCLKFWRILVGPWLGVFLTLLSDRWACLESALSSFDISGSILLEGSEKLIPNDMTEFNFHFSTDRWNHAIFSQILPFLSDVPLVIHKDVPGIGSTYAEDDSRGVQSSTSFLKKLLRKILSGLTLDKDVVLCAPYLSVLDELKTSLALGQAPLFLRHTQRIFTSANDLARNWSLASPDQSPFERCARELVAKHIPSNYLEGFGSLTRAAELQKLPKSPRAIMTSNSFYADDLFKIWAAKKVESGVPLVIGQHGGNYGMGLWSWSESHELRIADSYFSWGWKKSAIPNIRPLCKFKPGYKRRKNAMQRGRILLVTVMLQRFGSAMLSMYSGPQWLRYLEDQFIFVDTLPDCVRDRITVRLSKPDYGWHQMERWAARFPDLDLDDGRKNLEELVKETSLFVGTYNATTYLDAMAANIPTVIFWNPTFMEMNSSAEADFDNLKDVRVFHHSPQSAAEHIARIAGNLEGWWFDDKTQCAVNSFLYKYARSSSNVSREISSALRDVMRLRKVVG
jgi:putative transferase (TIGR04331 family)